VPSGSISGKIVKIARADNRAEIINILGIDIFDASGARITTGTPTSSSVWDNNTAEFGPQNMNDGVHQATASGKYRMTHTMSTTDAYVQIDLGSDKVISKIVIYNRTDTLSIGRINGCNLTVTNAAGTNVLTIPLSGSKAIYTFSAPLTNSSTTSTYMPEPFDDAKDIAGY